MEFTPDCSSDRLIWNPYESLPFLDECYEKLNYILNYGKTQGVSSKDPVDNYILLNNERYFMSEEKWHILYSRLERSHISNQVDREELKKEGISRPHLKLIIEGCGMMAI